MVSTRYGSKNRGVPTGVHKRAFDIKLLGEDEFPANTFNGDLLLMDAKEKAFTIDVQ